MTRMMHDDQLHFARRYGDICALRAFGEDFILLNSYDVIYEATFVKPMDFVNRPFGDGFIVNIVDPNKDSLNLNNLTTKLQEFRIACSSIFRYMGVGRAEMEENIQNEADILIGRFESQSGKPFDSLMDIRIAVTNVIMGVLFNKHYAYDDFELHDLIEILDSTLGSLEHIFILDMFPWSRFLPGLRKHYLNITEGSHEIKEFMFEKAREVVADEETHGNSFCEEYAEKYVKCPDRFNNVLKHNLGNLLVTGTDTLYKSIQWTIKMLCNHQGVQTKLYEAIRDVIGQDGRYTQTCKIPYLDAVVLEVQRFCTLAPVEVPHSVSTKGKVTLGGHVVPNDATYIFNLFAVHRDPKTG